MHTYLTWARLPTLVLALACTAVTVRPAVAAAPVPAKAAASQGTFTREQLDQMLAPVALYPDSLLSQLLMACTYPSDFAEATAWVNANQKASGDAAVKQVESKPWDPSVKSLVAFPQILAQFGAQPDWVQKVGDAFLAQPEDVMAAVQRLRAQAQKAGTLKTTEQQKVIVEQAPPDSATETPTIIQIEPANPEVVYVPTYNPTVVYGSWPYPSYPPYYYPPPPYYYHPVASGLAAGLAFGIGIAAINNCWGGFNWGGGNVNINVNKFNNVNVNNRINGSGKANWNHNAANRRGTPYADNRSRQNYGQGVGGANQRSQYRGNDASRQRAQQSFDRSTGTTAANRGTGAGNRTGGNQAGAANRSAGAANRDAGNRSAGAGSRDMSGGAQRSSSSAGRSNNAFSGASSPQSSQRQASRGQSSQRSMSSSGGRSSAGRPASRPSPSRGGGGGGRRR